MCYIRTLETYLPRIIKHLHSNDSRDLNARIQYRGNLGPPGTTFHVVMLHTGPYI